MRAGDMEHIIMEATETKLHPNYRNGKKTFLPKQVTEATTANPEGMKEGPSSLQKSDLHLILTNMKQIFSWHPSPHIAPARLTQ